MEIRLVMPVLHSEVLVQKHKVEYQGCASPGVEISLACLTRGTRSIESEYDMALAQPETVRLVKQAEADGVAACIITCFGDPGAAAAKEVVSIPVVGEGEAAIYIAALLGFRFTILITERSLFPMMRSLVRRLGLEARLASVRAVGESVFDFSLDCLPRVVNESVRAIEDDGAEVIVMGCTGVGLDMPNRVREGISSEIGVYVPVIDPAKAAMKLAEALVTTGLSHSKIAYPTPRIARPEYLFASD